MGRYLNFLGLMFVLVLGQTPAALATDYEFTTIDFPGAPFSEALGISNVGEIVGAYGSAGPEHGFLPTRGTSRNASCSVPATGHSRARETSADSGMIDPGWQRAGGGGYHVHLVRSR